MIFVYREKQLRQPNAVEAASLKQWRYKNQTTIGLIPFQYQMIIKIVKLSQTQTRNTTENYIGLNPIYANFIYKTAHGFYSNPQPKLHSVSDLTAAHPRNDILNA